MHNNQNHALHYYQDQLLLMVNRVLREGRHSTNNDGILNWEEYNYIQD